MLVDDQKPTERAKKVVWADAYLNVCLVNEQYIELQKHGAELNRDDMNAMILSRNQAAFVAEFIVENVLRRDWCTGEPLPANQPDLFESKE